MYLISFKNVIPIKNVMLLLLKEELSTVNEIAMATLLIEQRYEQCRKDSIHVFSAKRRNRQVAIIAKAYQSITGKSSIG